MVLSNWIPLRIESLRELLCSDEVRAKNLLVVALVGEPSIGTSFMANIIAKCLLNLCTNYCLLSDENNDEFGEVIRIDTPLSIYSNPIFFREKVVVLLDVKGGAHEDEDILNILHEMADLVIVNKRCPTAINLNLKFVKHFSNVCLLGRDMEEEPPSQKNKSGPFFFKHYLPNPGANFCKFGGNFGMLPDYFVESAELFVNSLFINAMGRNLTGATLFKNMEPVLKYIQNRQEKEEAQRRKWSNRIYLSAETVLNTINSWLAFLLPIAVVIISIVGFCNSSAKYLDDSRLNGTELNGTKLNGTEQLNGTQCIQSHSMDFALSVVLCIVSIRQSWHVLCTVFKFIYSLVTFALSIFKREKPDLPKLPMTIGDVSAAKAGRTWLIKL